MDLRRLRLDPAGSSPLSAQLRDGLAAEVAGGRLLPGDRLPPVRAMASELGLAPNTVAKAYRELERLGLLVGRGRRGTFVADRLPRPLSEAEAALAEAASAFVRRARQLGARDAAAVRAIQCAQRARREQADAGHS